MCVSGSSAAKRAANAQAEAAKQTMQFAQQDWDYKQPFRQQYTDLNAAMDPIRTGFMSYLSGQPLQTPSGAVTLPTPIASDSGLAPAQVNPYLSATSGFDPGKFLATSISAPKLQTRTPMDYSSMLSTLPTFTGSEITPYKAKDYASLLPTVTELNMSEVPKSYTPSADLLAKFGDTPDWQAVGDSMQHALTDAYDIKLGQDTEKAQNSINADLLRRGLSTSSVADNAGIGLGNWARQQKALNAADTLSRVLSTESALRDESRGAAISQAGLERTAAQDALTQYQAGEELARMRRAEIANQLEQKHSWGLSDYSAGLTGEQALLDAAARYRQEQDARASLLRDWGLSDTAYDNDVITRQSALDAAMRNESQQNLWSALAWLTGDQDRLRAMGDTTSTMGSMVGASNAMGNAAAQLAQIAANNGSMWGSILGTAGMLAGAK